MNYPKKQKRSNTYKVGQRIIGWWGFIVSYGGDRKNQKYGGVGVGITHGEM